MKTYNISRQYEMKMPQTQRTEQVAEIFGLSEIVDTKKAVVSELPICIEPGTITYICGPSGVGKTSIIADLQQQLAVDGLTVKDVNVIDFDKTIPLVDCLDSVSLEMAMKLLSAVGLSEVSVMVDSYDHLSTGQQFRFRLVYALMTKPEVIIADEFCSSLDDITASVIACNVRRMVSKTNVCLVAASTDNSISDYLRPEVIIHKSFGKSYSIDYKDKDSAQ